MRILYKLTLDGTGSDCARLTHVSDFKNYKAHNATVAPDGKSMVYQISHGSGHSDMVSRGFVLYRFERSLPLGCDPFRHGLRSPPNRRNTWNEVAKLP